MYLRKATIQDFKKVIELLNKSINLLKSENIDQWQDNMPNEDTFKEDIEKQRLYVLVFDGQVVGMATIHEEIEESYENLNSGKWINDDRYATIHRFSVDTDFSGKKFGNFLFACLISVAVSKGFKTIKIDTHKDNLRMQYLIQKNDFKYCGNFYIDGVNDEKNFRLAYQWVI
ncbi:acetyltransferase [Spiroplasma taiwanense CT-1]|uniref:Acetyltransferase n=2 Tax=Spiroplasma taiwanense TaxID=2145 RepID=S5LT93_9MOLU|nr:acetyltransferase [Spiroplasma taiwanense CT-1]